MIREIGTSSTVLLSGEVGAPGDLDGRSLILEVAGAGETGVLRMTGERGVDLWFDRGRPVHGSAEGLVGLDGRLEQELPAERFAEAERRADLDGSLPDELASLGVAPDRLREELRGLVLDVLRILVDATGPYEFVVCAHRYSGASWVSLDEIAPVTVESTIPDADEDPADGRRSGVDVAVEPAVEADARDPASSDLDRSSRAADIPRPMVEPRDVPLVAQSMPSGVLGIQLDPPQWLVALALAEPRSERMVADRTGLTERAVATAVDHLRRAGLIGDVLMDLNEPPSVAPVNPITGRRARETTLVLADNDDSVAVGADEV